MALLGFELVGDSRSLAIDVLTEVAGRCIANEGDEIVGAVGLSTSISHFLRQLWDQVVSDYSAYN